MSYIDYTNFPEMLDRDEINFIFRLVIKMYGPAHPDVSIGGVYFWNERGASTFYPSPNPFYIAIVLPIHQREDGMARLMHLAHELVHCLHPNGPPGGRATMLEEGLAEHAKILLCEQYYEHTLLEPFDFRSLSTGNYRRALELVECLIGDLGLPAFYERVQLLRSQTNLPFAQISFEQLADLFPTSSAEVLKELSLRCK